MKTFLITILTLTSISIFAQQYVTWKGGTPGRENAWNEARNWSNNKVPNEFSDVFIPDVSTSTFSTPIIKEGTIELNSITIESTGQLTVEASAKMIIYGYTEGLIRDDLQIEGYIVVTEEIKESDLKNIVKLDK